MNQSINYSRKLEVYNAVQKNTEKYLPLNNYNSIGMDASRLSRELHMDRANISRILNQLFNEGSLIKVQGKPTLYIAKEPLACIAEDKQHLPSIIAKGENLSQILSGNTRKKQIKRMNILSDCIGIQRNESLYDVMKAIESAVYYPGKGLNILIQGKKYTEKGILAELIANQYLDSYGIKNSRCITMNCYKYDLNSFTEYVTNHSEIQQAKVIIMKNIDFLVEKNIGKFQFIQSSIFNVSTRKIASPFMIATSNIDFTGETFAQLRTIFPAIVNLPDFNHRTTKEKLEYTLSIFQQEADFIQLPISISKEVVNCFASAHYSSDIQNLKSEIRLSVSAAYSRVFTSSINLVYVHFEDISHELLSKENMDITICSELSYLYTYLNMDDFMFIPHSACKELNMLKSLQIEEMKNLNTSSLFQTCDILIRKSSHALPYISRSRLSTNVYDCIYPCLASNVLMQNKNLVYCLTEHIARLITNIRVNNYHCPYAFHDQEIIEEAFLKLGNDIYSKISKTFQIPLIEEEQLFLAAFLQQSCCYLNSSMTSILLICNGESIAKSYAEYMCQIRPHLNYYYLNYNTKMQNEGFSAFQQTVSDTLMKIYNLPGVIVFTDIAPMSGVCSVFEQQTGIRVITLSPLSLPLLIHTSYLLEEKHYTPEQIQALYKESPSYASQNLYPPTEWSKTEKAVMKTLQEDILSESMTFLDYRKASNLLLEVYHKILEELCLPNDQSLMVKFILDGCYAIERTIRQESLPFHRLKQYIEKHHAIYQFIEQETEMINNSFNIHLPSAELAALTKLFAE